MFENEIVWDIFVFLIAGPSAIEVSKTIPDLSRAREWCKQRLYWRLSSNTDQGSILPNFQTTHWLSDFMDSSDEDYEDYDKFDIILS